MEHQASESRDRLSRNETELDLLSIFKALSTQSEVIKYSTLIALVVTTSYAFLVAPTYIASAQLTPPYMSDIENIRPSTSEPKSDSFLYTPDASLRQQQELVELVKRGSETSNTQGRALKDSDVFSMFLTELSSHSHIHSLAKEDKDLLERALGLVVDQDLFREVNKKRWVTLSNTEEKINTLEPDSYVLSVTGEDKEALKELLKKDLDLASASILTKIKKHYTNHLNLLIRETSHQQLMEIESLQSKIDARKKYLQQERKMHILQLEEAILTGRTISSDNIPQMQAELELLRKRPENTFYDSELNAMAAQRSLLENNPYITHLKSQLDYINSYDLSLSLFNNVFDTPKAPIKPNKPILILIGLIGGFMIGVGIATINLVRKKLSTHTTS